jgi:hypothetical protein
MVSSFGNRKSPQIHVPEIKPASWIQIVFGDRGKTQKHWL